MTNVTSVTKATYVDINNGLFVLGQLLGSATMTAPATAVAITTAIVDSLWSETVVYDIFFKATGGAGQPQFAQDNSTVNIEAVPEPASLAIFGGALLGFGLMRRRRRNS